MAKKKAFERARKDLIELRRITVENNVYRLAGDAATLAEKCIAEVLKSASDKATRQRQPRDMSRAARLPLGDDTRNEVQRHEVAGVVAGRTAEALHKAKTAIEERAEVLFNDGVAEAEREFAPRASRASLESEIRSYIREQAKQPDGAANVRAAMLESKDVAAVIFHSPAFLVGINPETHSKLRFDASERWLPDA